MQCWNCKQTIADGAAACVFCESQQADDPAAEITAIQQQLEKSDLSAEERAGLESKLQEFEKMLHSMLDSIDEPARQELQDLAADSKTAEDFAAAILIGDCPSCGSAETQDCENVIGIADPSVGRCRKCGVLFCPDCGVVFVNDKPTAASQKCPHCGSTDTSYEASQELPEDGADLADTFVLECYSCGDEYCAFCGSPLAPAEEDAAWPITCDLTEEETDQQLSRKTISTTNQSGASYRAPVDKLLTLGQPKRHGTSVNYEKLGIGREQVPELIRMTTDEALNSGPTDSQWVWAPVHAWWALAQLQAAEAIAPLLSLLPRINGQNDDWVGEDVPRVLAAIGPVTIDPVAAYLADPAHDDWARVAAASTLGMVGQKHPETRAMCIARLSAQLERFAEQSDLVNAYLISPLLDLRAVESAPVMERAFAAGRVDEMAQGDWEDVQIELGLKTHREHPPKPNELTRLGEQMRAALGVKLTADHQLVPLEAEEVPMLEAPASKKVGRNDPCPCGSGKKFKKCCGR